MLDQNLTIIYDLSKSFKMNSRPIRISMDPCGISKIRVITKLPNSEQSYKGKVKTHKYINRQNQSTTGKL
jgi:hypothetical protein